MLPNVGDPPFGETRVITGKLFELYMDFLKSDGMVNKKAAKSMAASLRKTKEYQYVRIITNTFGMCAIYVIPKT